MKINTSAKMGLGIGFLGAIVISAMLAFAFLRSTSSTAAIGFIFIPVYFVIAFIGFFVWGYFLGYIKAWLASTDRIFNSKIIVGFFVGICFAVLLFGGLGRGLLVTSVVSHIRAMNTNQELVDTFKSSYFKNNTFILGAIAQNPAASAELLDQIARLRDPRLQEAMGSFFPVLGDNKKGLAVMRLVTRNPHVSTSTIEYLASMSQNDYVLGDTAYNSKTSIETLRKLETKKNYLIDWGLAYNQNTPEDIYLKLLERPDDAAQSKRYTLESIVANKSASPEIRARASDLLKKY